MYSGVKDEAARAGATTAKVRTGTDKPKRGESATDPDRAKANAETSADDNKDAMVTERKDPSYLVTHINKALNQMYHTNETEFENYAEENNLKKGKLGTILKMMQYKLVSHLIQEKVKIKDLSWICIYNLFEKHSVSDPKYNGVRTLQLSIFQTFMKELEVTMSPFEELHPQLSRDISRMKDFEADSNLMDDQYVFAHYIKDTQK